MKFIQTHNAGSDCTAPYDVEDIKAQTIQDFIQEVLTQFPDEWGYFNIEQERNVQRIEYKFGKLLDDIPQELKTKSFNKDVKASGGWSRMDYFINISKKHIIMDKMKEQDNLQEAAKQYAHNEWRFFYGESFGEEEITQIFTAGAQWQMTQDEIIQVPRWFLEKIEDMLGKNEITEAINLIRLVLDGTLFY